MSFFSTTEFKVGALIIAIGGLIAFMSIQVSSDPSYLGRTKKAWFLLPNANGLIKGSAVKSAGIPVGVIEDIRLQDGMARININIKSEVGLRRSGVALIKANGILGDKYIEIMTGNLEDSELENGGQIVNVKSAGGIDDVMGEVSEIASSLKSAAASIGEAMAKDGTNEHILGRIVINIEKLTSNLNDITEDNKGQIRDIVNQLDRITKTVDELVNDDTETGFKNTWNRSMARIDSSLKNIEEITAKINNGEGAIGKLISDEQTAEDVSSAIEGLSSLVDTASRISTAFDFNGYYLSEIGEAKSAIGIHIQPGLDRYYYLGLVSDPMGVVRKMNYHSTGTPSGEVSYDETKTYKNKTKFTAYYAKNFYDFTVKGGMIEDTGGIGLDYLMFNRRLITSIEAYDFSSLQLRANVSYRFKYGIYLTAGVSDILDKNNAQSAYAGAGLYLTNDDLKLLLTSF